MVKESLNDGYCDISGNLGDLTRLGESGTSFQSIRSQTVLVQGEMGGVTLFCSKGKVCWASRKGNFLTNLNVDVPNPPELFKAKKDAIARFIHVIHPIRDLYRLPPTSVHIFCDLAGGTIAFNRNASIFLNLRYFEAWRMYVSLRQCHPSHQDPNR